MATSLGVNSLALRFTRAVLRQPQQCVTVVPKRDTGQYQQRISNEATHVVNRRRTHAEISKALRRKQNFLHPDMVEKHRHSPLQKGTENVTQEKDVTAPRNYRYVMPEFMPRPEWGLRDKVLEKLERRDMLRRRAVINIPEFYVGSIMAVTAADSYAPNKKNRFVGICIDRGMQGLKHFFILRNVVEGLGVEVMYEMYSPSILSIEVLKLEKRLDESLYYLRDALPEYSTFPFDMETVHLPRGAEVPLNTLKVKLKPTKEWHWRWERYNPLGVEPFEVNEKRLRRVAKYPSDLTRDFRYNDLMLQYRSKVPENEEEEIMAEVYKEKRSIDTQQKRGDRTAIKKERKRRTF